MSEVVLTEEQARWYLAGVQHPEKKRRLKVWASEVGKPKEKITITPKVEPVPEKMPMVPKEEPMVAPVEVEEPVRS